MFIIVVLFLPKGIVGTVSDWFGRIRQRTSAAPAGTAQTDRTSSEPALNSKTV
jgi:hypothetical protein